MADHSGQLVAGRQRVTGQHGLARARGTDPVVASYHHQILHIDPHPVVHTSHPTYGYVIDCHAGAGRRRVVWAPEFWRFPAWAAGADLMFADAAGWTRPIRFARGTGGHASVQDTARAAREHGVRMLVFAHIGRPSIRAVDAGHQPPFGEWATDGRVYQLR